MSPALKNNAENPDWRPSAHMANLRLRAEIIRKIRAFFADRGVLEVDTPLLCPTTVTAPQIESMTVYAPNKNHGNTLLGYLQTSPEYAMKRLLASGSGDIYQLCKAFRLDESGRLHHPEFTMLEWYRVNFNLDDLMAETSDLLQYILACRPAQKISYQQLFLKYLNIDPHTENTEKLKNIYLNHHALYQPDHLLLDRDDWLQLLLTHHLEPLMEKESRETNAPLFIYDFPASQAALAKIREGNPPVAERFEAYFYGLELANGYHELINAKEQAKRFAEDIQKRADLNLPTVAADQALLAALEHGLPDCAGIALGVDRLVMLAARQSSIREIMAFAG